MPRLTLKDLENFYCTKKKSFHFSAEDENDAIVVQIPGSISFSEEKYDPTMGLLPVHLQSCHIDKNRNNSNISKEIMEKCKTSIYNRPILGYIHKLSNGEYDFAGHEMYINENGEMEYEEIGVGTIPESSNPELIYDEDKDKTYLEVDGYIYEEYTKAAEILKKSKEKKVSVEIALLDFSYNAKTKTLDIENFYFSGVTILGTSRNDETPIEEGMLGSNIKLKDFSENKNSIFSSLSNEENTKLIEILEKLNNTLSKFNIDNNCRREDEIVFEENNQIEETVDINVEDTFDTDETVDETDETVDTVQNDGDKTPAEDVVDAPAEETADEAEETVEDTPEVIESENCNDVEATENLEESVENDVEDVEEQKFTKTFELAFDDITSALYQLLMPYEEADNDWYWISKVYDTYFVYQGLHGNYYGQKYTKTDTNVAFDGERYELYAEFVTASEKAELDAMRANYSSISEKLASYQLAEELADKSTVFEDNAYANYLETVEFKELMKKETLKQFTKEELVEKADAALGKLVKTNKTFSMSEKVVERKPVFGFAKFDNNSSFLDGLLKK